MITYGSGDVFADLGFDEIESQNLRVRSDLMDRLVQLIQENGWRQEITAEKLGISQPRVSNLMRGKIHLFTVDTLLAMLGRVGQSARVNLVASTDEAEIVELLPADNAHLFLDMKSTVVGGHPLMLPFLFNELTISIQAKFAELVKSSNKISTVSPSWSHSMPSRSDWGQYNSASLNSLNVSAI